MSVMSPGNVPAHFLLAAMYNLSKPLGRGHLHFVPGDMTPGEALDLLEAQGFPDKPARFEYVKGRVIKVTFERKDGQDVVHRFDLYDRDVGQGAVWEAFQLAQKMMEQPEAIWAMKEATEP